MKVTTTAIKDLLIIEPSLFADERGWFIESFNERQFNAVLAAHCIQPVSFVQDNLSLSKVGVLRGLHYQSQPYAQAKLVRVIQGKIWDVAVDIRQSSPTFGQWVGLELSADNKKMFWIPAGFAHGFIALEDNTQVLYKVSDYYEPSADRSLLWSDAELAIEWPVAAEQQLIIHARDQQAKSLQEARQSHALFD